MTLDDITLRPDQPIQLEWRSAYFTHSGNVRKYNEDACLARDAARLWAVADGMGGHEAGDVASQLIMQKLVQLEPIDDLASMIDRIDDALINANQELRRLGREKYNNRTIGSTVVTLCAVDNNIGLLWAGDSRIYRIRQGKIEQMTHDHSEVQNLVDQGLLAPEEAEEHPSSNVITRAIGASEDLYLSTAVDKAQPGDIYVLCSDGLYRDVKAEEILHLSNNPDINDFCQTLLKLALSREAKDNITTIIVQCLPTRD